MNKQELIDKLASLVGSIEDFKGISTFHDGKYAGLEHALELIKQLDEPQKPFVPKFVADYIEEYRGGGATLYEMMDSSEDEVYTWLFGNPRIETENERQLLFAQAYAVGYEVEEEPKWVVKSNRLYFTGITQLIAREPITYNFTTDEKRAHVFDDKESAEKEASFFDGTVEKVKV